MNLKIIIASALGTVFLGGAVIGFCLEAKKDDEKCDGSRIKKSAPVYECSSKTKYELLNYSFEISDDFILESPDNINEKYEGRLTFSGENIPRIEISGSGTSYGTAEFNARETYRSMLDSESCADTAYEIIPSENFNICAYHYRETDHPTSGMECISNYEIIYQTNKFNIIAFYSPENKDYALSVLEDIALSAVYTSDFRLPAEPYTFDSKYISVSCDPKWIIVENTEESLDEDGCGNIYTASIDIAEADSDAEYAVKVKLSVDKPKNDRTPSILADMTFTRLYEKESKNIKFDELERGQEEIFGYKAETCSYKITTDSSTDICWFQKTYWFEKDSYVYSVSVRKDASDKSSDKVMDEMIKSIKIK